jgi:hypothetical protein
MARGALTNGYKGSCIRISVLQPASQPASQRICAARLRLSPTQPWPAGLAAPSQLHLVTSCPCKSTASPAITLASSSS